MYIKERGSLGFVKKFFRLYIELIRFKREDDCEMKSISRRLVSLALLTIMATGLVVLFAPQTAEASTIPQRNRAVAFPMLGVTTRETFQNNFWGASVGADSGLEIVFDATQPGTHTISFPLWPSAPARYWHHGSAIKLFMPTNPSSPALPVSIESISIGGDVKMQNRAFVANPRFYHSIASGPNPRPLGGGTMTLPSGQVHGTLAALRNQNLSIHAFFLPVGRMNAQGQPEFVHINHQTHFSAAYPSDILGVYPSGGSNAAQTMEIKIRVGEMVVQDGNFGDVNGDGIINASDATMLRRFLANPSNPPAGFIRANAYIAANNDISAADLTRLRLFFTATNHNAVQLGPSSELERWPAPPPRPAWAAERIAGFAATVDLPAAQRARLIALTFDDGPHPIWTPMILNHLRDTPGGPHTATFYINPMKINDATIHIIHRMINEGHDVEHHGWDHTSFQAHNTESALVDMRQASQAIFDATGYWPWTFRAPFFEWGVTRSGRMDELFHMAFHGANIDTLDYQASTANNVGGGRNIIANSVTGASASARDGMIALFHDDGGGTRLETAESVPLIINNLVPRGYRFVTVRELHEAYRVRPVQSRGIDMPGGMGLPHPNGLGERRNSRAVERWGVDPLWPDGPTDTPWWELWHSDNNPWTNEIPPWQRPFG
jgi:peptidoglycan/xylan/chitin deacetylase (PgdA/CDA1 family)